MLEAKKLGFYYKTNEWLFRNLDISVAPGEILAILGPNGKGKTTFLNCLSGRLEPREGKIQRPDVVGFVPQSHESAFGFSALEMALMGATNRMGMFQTPGKEHTAEALGFLDRVGMQDFAHQNYARLSGGQKQLVLIARALLSRSPVLLLDEPVSSLDLSNQGKVMQLVRQLSSEHLLSVVYTTHHPEHAFYADKVLLMHRHDDVQFGTPSEVLNEDNLGRLYGVPVQVINIEYNGRSWNGVIPLYEY